MSIKAERAAYVCVVLGDGSSLEGCLGVSGYAPFLMKESKCCI